MECRPFQLTLNSANNLEDVRKKFRMKVYATVCLAGNSDTEKKTPPDNGGGINPVWNFPVKYTIGESAVRCDNFMVTIKLYCKRTLGGDRYIGEVTTSIKQLFDHAQPSGGSAGISFPVKKGGKDSQGMLKFAYSFGETVVVKETPKWKKFLKNGAVIFLLDVAATSTLGVPIFGGIEKILVMILISLLHLKNSPVKYDLFSLKDNNFRNLWSTWYSQEYVVVLV